MPYYADAGDDDTDRVDFCYISVVRRASSAARMLLVAEKLTMTCHARANVNAALARGILGDRRRPLMQVMIRCRLLISRHHAAARQARSQYSSLLF